MMTNLSAVVLVLVLAVAPYAAAECAWVLWSEDNVITGDPPDMRTLWTYIQAETTKKTCEETRSLRLDDAKKRGDSVDGQGNIFPTLNRMVRYVCAPDTIDPRGPKEGRR